MQLRGAFLLLVPGLLFAPSSCRASLADAACAFLSPPASRQPSFRRGPSSAQGRSERPRGPAVLRAALSAREKEKLRKKEERAAAQRRQLNDEKRHAHLLQLKEERRARLKAKREQQRSVFQRREDDDVPYSREERIARAQWRREQHRLNRKKQMQENYLRKLEKRRRRERVLAEKAALREKAREFMEAERRRFCEGGSMGRATTRAGKAEKVKELRYLLETSSLVVQVHTKVAGQAESEFGKGLVTTELAMTARQQRRVFEAFVNAGIHPYVVLKHAKNTLMRVAAEQAAGGRPEQTEARSAEEEAELEQRFWRRYEDHELTDEEMLAILGVDMQQALEEKARLEQEEAAAAQAAAQGGRSSPKGKKPGASSKSAAGKSGKSEKGGSKAAAKGKKGKEGAKAEVEKPKYDFDKGPPLPEPPNYRRAVAEAQKISEAAALLPDVAGSSRAVAQKALTLGPFLQSENLYLFVKASPAGEMIAPKAVRLLLAELEGIAAENSERAVKAAKKQRRRQGDFYDVVFKEGSPFSSLEEFHRALKGSSPGDALREERRKLGEERLLEAAKFAEAALGVLGSAEGAAPSMVGVALTPQGLLPPAAVRALAKLPPRKTLVQRLMTFLQKPPQQIASAVGGGPSSTARTLQSVVQRLSATLSAAHNAGWKKTQAEPPPDG